MAASITTVSSLIPKGDINGNISQSTFTDNSSGTEIQEISLTEITNAVNKLNTYVSKVKGYKNVYNYTIKSTSCQSIKTVTTCQTTTCQSSGCQSISCQKCQSCQRCQICQANCNCNCNCNC